MPSLKTSFSHADDDATFETNARQVFPREPLFQGLLSYCSCYHLAQFLREEEKPKRGLTDPSDRASPYKKLAILQHAVQRFSALRTDTFNMLKEDEG